MNNKIKKPFPVKTVQPVLDQNYWNTKWQNNQTGWDIGYASPAITAYMAQYLNKNAAILIAGCGNAYEAVYLLENNFTDITLIDFAEEAVKGLIEKFAGYPAIKILCTDFFEHERQYDLLLEQTFFCAIAPERRADYVQKVLSLLKPQGRIVGLLFDKVFEAPGPPFGGDVVTYEKLFRPFFSIDKMEKCYNSISPRAGKEIFINFSKP